jgi:hypothetical protein
MFDESLYWVALGRGLLDETGVWHRSAALEPLSGHQEAFLGSLTAGETNVRIIDELLAACIIRLGDFRSVQAEHAAALTKGDRERLALELRVLMHGDSLQISPRCANPLCGELADLDLSIRRIINDIQGPEPEWFSVDTPDGTAWLRPPTGMDEAVCQSFAGDSRERLALLWSRLVARVGDCEPLEAFQWEGLQPATRLNIMLCLAENQSAPDLSFVSPCPSCGTWMEFDLDPFALLARELCLGADRLLVETHCLAFHYGWSEDQVLALPRRRRWRYLELLRNQVEGRPLLDPWR